MFLGQQEYDQRATILETELLVEEEEKEGLLTTGVALVSCSNLLSPSFFASPDREAGSVFSRSTHCNSRDEWLPSGRGWHEAIQKSRGETSPRIRIREREYFRGVINNSPVTRRLGIWM